MDPTRSFDPNKTNLIPGGIPNPNDPYRTQAIPAGAPGFDPNRTSAMPGAPMDPNRTSAIPGLGAMPMGGPAISAEVVPGRTATLANGPAREQFLIDLHAVGAATGGVGMRTPLNLCLVIDRSGSMQGEPLEYVKSACCYVVDMLTPNDVLSIVTFEEVVDVLMPAQRVTNQQIIKDGIMRLMPGNTTNLYDGLSLGLQQVSSLNDPTRATRMIVLTDGDPTAGIKDFSALVNHAGEIKARGITTTFLGFGPDYNEELLASMAKKAGGNYYFIPQPSMIPTIFQQELEKLMTVTARNLSLTLKPARWVSMKAPQAASGGQSVSITLTDMERGSSLEQIVDLEFQNHPLGHYRVCSGRLTYEDTGSGQVQTIDLDMVMEFTADASKYSAPVHPRVAQAAQVQAASRVVEQTIMGMKTGMITAMGAISDLQKTQALLMTQGRTAEAQEVTMALRALQSGDQGGAEKTLMGTMVSLDQGKKQ